MIITLDSAEEIVLPEERTACLDFTRNLTVALEGALFSDDDSRENQTTVHVTALNGDPPCSESVESSAARRLSVEGFETVTSYETVISYAINTVISYSGEQEGYAEEEQLKEDTARTLSLETVQAAFQTPEIQATTGEATVETVRYETTISFVTEMTITLASAEEIVVPEERMECLEFMDHLTSALTTIPFQRPPIVFFISAISALNGFLQLPPCSGSVEVYSPLLPLPVQGSDAVNFMIITYSFSHSIHYDIQFDGTTPELVAILIQLEEDILGALSLENVQAAFRTPEMEAVTGGATIETLSIEHPEWYSLYYNGPTSLTSEEEATKSPTTSRTQSQSVPPTKSLIPCTSPNPITGKSGKNSKGNKNTKQSKISKRTKATKKTTEDNIFE